MITKAFKFLTSRRISQVVGSYKPAIPAVTKTFKDISGANISCSNGTGNQTSLWNVLSGALSDNYATNASALNSPNVCGIAFGTGTTPPTDEDYFVESYVSDFTFVSAAYSSVDQTDSLGTYDEIVASYKYTGASEVTITEVGYYGCMVHTGSSIGKFLVERELITPGVTLNTNDIITISIKLYHTGSIALS